jgi:hypothetical protein
VVEQHERRHAALLEEQQRAESRLEIAGLTAARAAKEAAVGGPAQRPGSQHRPA